MRFTASWTNTAHGGNVAAARISGMIKSERSGRPVKSVPDMRGIRVEKVEPATQMLPAIVTCPRLLNKSEARKIKVLIPVTCHHKTGSTKKVKGVETPDATRKSRFTREMSNARRRRSLKTGVSTSRKRVGMVIVSHLEKKLRTNCMP
jgi:hypothetical protein